MKIIYVLGILLCMSGLTRAQDTVGSTSVAQQPAAGSGRFAKVDAWLEANTPKMGGRAVLVVEKGESIVYSRAVNDRNGGQKTMDR
jgi:hypothetical protein